MNRVFPRDVEFLEQRSVVKPTLKIFTVCLQAVAPAAAALLHFYVSEENTQKISCLSFCFCLLLSKNRTKFSNCVEFQEGQRSD